MSACGRLGRGASSLGGWKPRAGGSSRRSRARKLSSSRGPGRASQGASRRSGAMRGGGVSGPRGRPSSRGSKFPRAGPSRSGLPRLWGSSPWGGKVWRGSRTSGMASFRSLARGMSPPWGSAKRRSGAERSSTRRRGSVSGACQPDRPNRSARSSRWAGGGGGRRVNAGGRSLSRIGGASWMRPAPK